MFIGILLKESTLNLINLTKDSQVCQVLFKSPARRLVLDKLLGTKLPENSELLSIIDEKETYNPDIYKPKKLL